MENPYPSNSQQNPLSSTPKSAVQLPTESKDKQPKAEKIITGSVIIRKKSLGKKFKEFLVGDDTTNVVQYVLHDILVPSARDMLFDALTSGIERKMYGETSYRRNRSHTTPIQQAFGNATYNAYHRYSTGGSTRRSDPREDTSPNRRGRAQIRELGELIFETRAEATEVLDAMIAIADQYNAISVLSLWDLLGRTGEPTDENYGWTSLMGTDIYKVPGGFLLDLPRPSVLD